MPHLLPLLPPAASLCYPLSQMAAPGHQRAEGNMHVSSASMYGKSIQKQEAQEVKYITYTGRQRCVIQLTPGQQYNDHSWQEGAAVQAG